MIRPEKKYAWPAPLLTVDKTQDCRIIERLNRFVVRIDIKGHSHLAHINNTGRLKEFLVRGRRAYCFKTTTGKVTDYRLFAIEEKGSGALIDTQLQMKTLATLIEAEALPWLKGYRIQRRNPRLGDSLLDFLLSKDHAEVYLEVKSAVLREGHYAMYPDCPTSRGQRHVMELTRYVQRGGQGVIAFMAALPQVTAFKPYRAGDPVFHELLRQAASKGVQVRAVGLYFNYQDRAIHLFDPDLEIVL